MANWDRVQSRSRKRGTRGWALNFAGQSSFKRRSMYLHDLCVRSYRKEPIVYLNERSHVYHNTDRRVE